MSRVLIVEDEAHLAKGLRFNLEAEGHSVQVVGDGESALDLLLGKLTDSKRKTAISRSARGKSLTPWCSTSCCLARMVLQWHRNYVRQNILFRC